MCMCLADYVRDVNVSKICFIAGVSDKRKSKRKEKKKKVKRVASDTSNSFSDSDGPTISSID